MISQGDEHVQMLEDCEKRSEKLTEWEQQFIDSLGHQIAERPLSEKQVEKLEKIWERLT